MNIVFLAPFAFSPKATVSARMLPMAAALVRRGHAVSILLPPYDNPADSGKRWSHEGVSLENARSGGYLAQARQLAARTRALQPAIVHAFKPIGVGALAMQLLAREFGAGLVIDNDDWEGHGGWLDVNPYSRAQKLFFAWQERWSLRRARAATCASEVLVTRTQALRGDRPGAVLLFPNGPDNRLRSVVAAAQAQREALRGRFGWAGQRVAMYAGTIPLGHDLDLITQSLQSALSSKQECRLCVIASGDGIPSFRAGLVRAGLAEHVEWHGFMPHDHLIERLVAADLALYPYRDTNINRAKCSAKVMDYMAAGMPIVASDVGMNRVYLEHGRSALLAPPGDAAAFGASFQRLLAEPTLASALGQAAQARIWSNFGWDRRIGALETLYQDL